MIKPLIAWGIGFGGVRFLATHGLVSAAPPAAAHNVFRGLTPAGGDIFRPGFSGTANVFGGTTPQGGKVFR